MHRIFSFTSEIQKPSLLVLCGTSLTRPFTNILVTFALGKGRIEFTNHLAPVQVVDLLKSDNCTEITGLIHDKTIIGVLTWLSAKDKINKFIDVQSWDDEPEFSYLFSELRLALNQYTCAPQFREWINPVLEDSIDESVKRWRSYNRLVERKFSRTKSISRLSIKDYELSVRMAEEAWNSCLRKSMKPSGDIKDRNRCVGSFHGDKEGLNEV